MCAKKISKTSPVVIFVHIPKAAGTTMHSLLQRVYRASTIRDLDTADLRRSIMEFNKLPAAEKDKIDLLKGHLPFGMHEGFTRKCTYITMLRNPVDRIISHYRYASENTSHYLNHYITEKKMDLMAYVGSGISAEMDNAMVRILSNNIYDLPYGGCTSEMLESAKNNLVEYFSVIGLAEKFDESVLLMRQKLNWPSYPIYYNKKVSRSKMPSLVLEDKVIDYIRATNSLDCELYEFGKKIFDAEVAVNKELLTSERKKFRRMNAVYRVFAVTRNEVVSKMKRLVPAGWGGRHELQ